VDLRRREVRVLTPQGQSLYLSGQSILLFFGAKIKVDEIFL
jgi:hypothetical protein